MQKEVYADELAQIHYTGNMARFDFSTINVDSDEKSQNTFRVIMPVQGFLKTCDTMKNLIDRLVANGILQKTTPASAPAKGPEVKNAPKAKPEAKPAKKTAKKTAKKHNGK